MTVAEAKRYKRLTLDQVRSLETEVLTPALAAKYLGITPYSINLAARNDPDLVGFPLFLSGNRVKIPKAGFISWAEGGNK